MGTVSTTVAAQRGSPPRPKSADGLTAQANRRRNNAGEDRLRSIAEAAYFRAEQRGFAPGQELEDWLAAEIEIDALLGEDEDRG